jgi:oligopeptide transport system ATP-binding protein
MPEDLILSVKELRVSFTLRGQNLLVLRDVSLDIKRGESVAIVGESGSGKSVFCKALMGLLDANAHLEHGEMVYFTGQSAQDLAALHNEKEWQSVRGGEIAMVMQDPMTSLNPLQTVGDQVKEAVAIHQKLTGKAAKETAIGYLADVGIQEPQRRYRQYPHEFSGGIRQRVVIAIAMACKPKVLICDEPTTAIDVTLQAQILALLRDLQEKYALTIIYVTHDLGVVARVADSVAVMYAGDFVEIGQVEEIFYTPQHPYTSALLKSLPQLSRKGEEIVSIPGTPPGLNTDIRGDAFAMRNPGALKIDFVERSPFFQVSPTHKARTWLLDTRAKKAASI